MHELALSQQIARIVTRAAAGRRVAAVHLEVGHLRQVVPEALEHAWSATVNRTPLALARLVVTPVPAVVRCADCHAETMLTGDLSFACRPCGSRATRVVRGEEFRVTAIDVDDPADAAAPARPTREG